MNIIFAGPTISHSLIRQHLDCVCLPPVCHGDILSILPQSPDAIGIIDGYFEGVPSVWHKEILYAMDQGVRVYGSSSMGALRAAETCMFGMVGVGRIFQWYKDGLLEDDDEVAVLHGPEETGYLTASVPMVNIRATLDLARQQAIINAGEQEALLQATKDTFYKQRSWSRLMLAANELFADQSVCKKLEVWLATHKVDQKRDDAMELLALMQSNAMSAEPIVDSHYHFEWTNVWDVAFRDQQRSLVESKSPCENDQKVLDQLRLDDALYQYYYDKAVLSWLCRNTYETQVDEQALKMALKNFRADNRLDSRAQLARYMEKTGLDESSLTALMNDISRVDLARQAAGNVEAGILSQLKVDGRYVEFFELAEARQKA